MSMCPRVCSACMHAEDFYSVESDGTLVHLQQFSILRELNVFDFIMAKTIFQPLLTMTDIKQTN